MMLSISRILISNSVQCRKMLTLILLTKNTLHYHDKENFKKLKEKLSLNMVQKGAYLVG